jgi:predicted GIY-YIG superfamily endonuclease
MAHNGGRVKATRYLRPWKFVYVEEHDSSTEARKREWSLKKMKSRTYLSKLIDPTPGTQGAFEVSG